MGESSLLVSAPDGEQEEEDSEEAVGEGRIIMIMGGRRSVAKIVTRTRQNKKFGNVTTL